MSGISFNPFFTKSNFDVDGDGSLGGEFKNAAGGIAGFAANTIGGFSYRPFVPNIPDTTLTDPSTGRPIYNLGTQDEMVDAIGQDRPRGTLANNALGGVAAGAKFGPAGALIGGAIGTISGLFQKRKQKKRIERARREAAEEFEMKQNMFNERDVSASITQEAKIRSQQARRNNFGAPLSLI